MKKVSVFIVMLVLIVVSFSSCKKEIVYSHHIFWFNKATSDSLKAKGVETLRSSAIDYKPNIHDKWYSFADADDWYASEPAFDQYGMICLSIELKKNETKSFSYEIIAMGEMPSQEEILSHMSMLKGAFEMKYASTTYTQLIWE